MIKVVRSLFWDIWRKGKWELTALRPCILIALGLEHFWVADFCWMKICPPQTAKRKTYCIELTVLPAITCKMKAVRASLGYRKEGQVGVDRPPAMHSHSLGSGALLGCWHLIWADFFCSLKGVAPFVQIDIVLSNSRILDDYGSSLHSINAIDYAPDVHFKLIGIFWPWDEVNFYYRVK